MSHVNPNHNYRENHSSYNSSSHGNRDPNDNISIRDSNGNKKEKLNDSRITTEEQFKHLSKNRSATDIQMTKFAKLKSLQKNPLTVNEDGDIVISAGDLIGMGKLNNVKYQDIGMNDVLDELVNDLNDNYYDASDYNISSQDMKKNAKILETMKGSPRSNSKIASNAKNVLISSPSMMKMGQNNYM